MWRDVIEERIGSLRHPAWGPEHCRRLYDWEREIADDEQLLVEDDVLFAIAWLHDVGTFGEFSPHADTPAECAALAAARLLPEAGFPPQKLELVVRTIRLHSFEGDGCQSAEACVLRDADMLEFLGAIGLQRLLSIVGLEEWVPDPRAALSLALEFASTLPGKLYFDASRRFAVARMRETLAFVDALAEETGGLAWV